MSCSKEQVFDDSQPHETFFDLTHLSEILKLLPRHFDFIDASDVDPVTPDTLAIIMLKL